MIVDKHSDLNIYKERVQDEEEASCCAPKATASSCCSTAESFKSSQASKEETAKRVEEIDFNEWVSKLHL
jgi:arsenite methyltransferase